MFDNPEKLFILLVIALLIFGPSKMAGLGSTIGRTIKDFRSAVRGAHETFTSELEQATAEVEPPPPALPSPDPATPPLAAPDRLEEAAWRATGEHESAAASSAPASDPDGLSSLASEPTAEALRKSLKG